MAVSKFKERDSIVVKWTEGLDYEGPVSLKTSAEGSDPSGTELVSNQGFAAVSFPLGEMKPFHCKVFDQDGNLLDEGDVDPNE